jgi:hypothetical protein
MPTGWASVLSGLITVSGAAIEFTALTGSRTAIAQNIIVVAGDVLTFSMDVDAVSGTGTDALAAFEVVTGAALSGSTTIVVSGGTGRKTASTTVTTGGLIRVRIGASVSVNATTNCVATLKAPQLEKRSFATAYTATTTQPITRYQRQLKTAAVNEWPREFDPVTGECLGRSIWESRTNLLLRSEDLSTTWTNQESTESVNVDIAPDGTLTADKLVPSVVSDSHWINQSVTVTAAAHTFTFFAKADGYSVVQALNGNSGSDFVNFDLSTGLVGSAVGYTGTMTNIGNGWYRCAATVTTSASTAGWARIGIVPASTSTRGAAFAGDGSSGVLIWGAQLEAGAFATPYIPTVAAQVTRVADSAEITGVNFSSWFRQDEGSFFVDSTNSGTFGIPINIHDGTANNQYQVLTGTSGTAFLVTTANVVQANFGTRATPAKTSASYKFNDFMASTNGSVPATDTSGTLPVVSVARIGSRYDNSSHINGYIKRLTYYPQALTSANLTAVTR